MEIKISLDELEKLYFAFMIQLTSQEQRISLAIYQQLAKGQAVSHDQLASHLSLSKQIIDDFLLDHIGVYYDENQNIIGYLGLTLAKMGHKIYIDNRQLYTWCAWDSLFIPSLLSKPARVESICPVTNKKISLTISSKGVAEIEPSNVVVSMLIPESEDKLKENIIMNFCHHVHFFSSPSAGSQWVDDKDGKYVLLTIDDAFELGQRRNKSVYKDVLTSED